MPHRIETTRTLTCRRLLPLGLLAFLALLVAVAPASAQCEGGFPNGVVEGSEICDDGNFSDTDFCSTTCQPIACEGGAPDGIVDSGEECDDGAFDGNAPDTCSDSCRIRNCMDDLTEFNNNCTANDVRLALVVNDEELVCELGSMVTLTPVALLEANSDERYDIGIFTSEDGGTARSGECFHTWLNPSLDPIPPELKDILPDTLAGGTCTVTEGAGTGTGEACNSNAKEPDPNYFGCTPVFTCDDGVTGCNSDYDCPVATTGTCFVTGDTCSSDADCSGSGDPCVGTCAGVQSCVDGYAPTARQDAAPFAFAGPYYNAEGDEDPDDTCGDIEQDVDTYLTFQQPITVPCVDTDGDGRIDIGSCLSWDNQKAQQPSCQSLDETLPNTPAKCRCETINLGNVFISGKIIVDKVTVPAGSSQLFDFDIDGPPQTDGGAAYHDDFQLADATSPFDSGALKPSALAGGDYSVAETVPAGWDLTSVVCEGDNGTPDDTSDDRMDLDPAAIDLQSAETVTCTFTNVQALVDITKTCDPLSKVGDDVDYQIVVTNNTAAGADDLVCTVSDSLLTVPAPNPVTLASGASQTYDVTRTVADGDPDPLVNNVSVSCAFSSDTSTEVASDTASCSTDLFQPSISFDKTGDALSKVGDDVDYTITLTNTSSSDTPDLECTVTDDLLGIDETVTLASGAAAHVINASRTVLDTDSDPLVNTAEVSCIVGGGFGNEVTASDGHSTDLFQPSISFDKTGDALSKVGDNVDYVITLNNTSSSDSPSLECTITDALLGINKSVTLAAGASDVTNASRTVLETDSDPLVNTASVSCSPVGFPNVLTASDGHSTNLFQPSISLDKTGDALSKVGDGVDYTITLTNTSSADTPDLECTITDAQIGLDETVTLSSGASDVTNVAHTIPDGAADPYLNTASASCSPVGFPNVLSASDGHSIDLFQPSISFDKTGDATAKAGDSVDYVITLNNTSSADSPDLECTITDAQIGLSETVTLASGASDVQNVSHTVPTEARDPYTNTASVSCSPVGFANVLDASDGHSIDLFQPSISFDKTGDALSKVGDDIDYVITLQNTSSADTPDLECTITDATLGIDKSVTLASGASDVTNASHTLVAGDPDPFVNTASVSCSPAGFPNVVSASDGHSTNLFQPSISFDKTGDALSKVGDDIDYVITLQNTSSADTPDLECTITDATLGIDKSVTLASGASDVTNASHTVVAGDPDPFVNTASVSCSPAGFPNVVSASDGHSTNLFQPSISFDKTGDALSKIGDGVNYTITLQNTSSADTPDLECTITDAQIGLNETVTLSSGASDVTNVAHTIPADASDPYLNTASVSCSPAGFPNTLTATDSHSINLFDIDVTIDKTGDAFSKVGDSVSYVITVANISSSDAPDLSCTVTDTPIGVSETFALAAGASNVIQASYTIQSGDSDPFVNTASVTCSVDGFPNTLGPKTDSHTVDLVHPALSVLKTCTNEPVPQEGPATWNILLSNTGDVDLIVTADDGIGTVNLAAGASQTFGYSEAGPFSGQATVSNTVTASWVLPSSFGLSNTDTVSSTATCDVGGRVKLLKLTNGVVDPTKSWAFELYDGPDGFGGTAIANGNTSGDADGVLEFQLVNLDPAQTYTMCELEVAAGFTATWKVDTDGDGVADTIVPAYNPNADDPIPADLGNRCFDFGAGTAYPILAGETFVFEVDNSFPGGDPRTPGYWKNWNTCSGGGQAQTAADNGGFQNGFWLVDDILNDPGITWDDILADDILFPITKCRDAVLILDQRALNNRKKMAKCGNFTLAMHLLAAQLNFAAGAETCQAALDAATAGELLLDELDHQGLAGNGPNAPCLRPQDDDYAEALALAGQLDLYNNGGLCSP